MDIRQQIEQERAALEASRLTGDEEAEIADRSELERLRAERRRNDAARREVDLQRREEAVRERFGEVQIGSISIDAGADSYVIVHDEAAFQAHHRAINSAAHGKKIDRAAVSRRYAIAVVQDWNGRTFGDMSSDQAIVTIDGVATTLAAALDKHLRAHSGQVTPIVNEASRLAGVFATERKSDG